LVGLEEEPAESGKLNTGSVLVDGASNQISRDQAETILSETEEFVKGEPADSSVDAWHYVHLK